MNKYYNTDVEEQETIINIDYAGSIVSVYTNQNTIYKRLYEKIGEPTKTFYIKNKISGARWNVPFEDKKTINLILSRPTLIGRKK